MRVTPVVLDPFRRPNRVAAIVAEPWLEDVVLAAPANANLLLRGGRRAVTDALDRVSPMFASPRIEWRPGRPLVLPVELAGGTLVLREIGALTRDDQRYLDEWATQSAPATRIVSTTSRSMVPLIDNGVFMERLYYRLNTVLVSVSTP
jgi:hypothetical protein